MRTASLTITPMVSATIAILSVIGSLAAGLWATRACRHALRDATGSTEPPARSPLDDLVGQERARQADPLIKAMAQVEWPIDVDHLVLTITYNDQRAISCKLIRRSDNYDQDS